MVLVDDQDHVRSGQPHGSRSTHRPAVVHGPQSLMLTTIDLDDRSMRGNRAQLAVLAHESAVVRPHTPP
ncbi:hypothetical protein [Streptomyces sp. NPDC047043]|uniref:hypothetical protein n=1 Tax=Streptomyces sp. NPDC047043 TaxID=3154497 RepID=UPI0033E393F5